MKRNRILHVVGGGIAGEKNVAGPHGGSAQQVPIDRKVLVREDVKDHALDGRGAGVEKRARSRAVGTMPRTMGPTVWMTWAAGRL